MKRQLREKKARLLGVLEGMQDFTLKASHSRPAAGAVSSWSAAALVGQAGERCMEARPSCASRAQLLALCAAHD